MPARAHGALAAVAMTLLPAAAAAEPPVLDLPILCEVGEDCFIQKYFDHDPGPGFRDFMCGELASPDHAATDFRLPDYVAMRRGVAVVAASPGVVRAVRDGMPDIAVDDTRRDEIAGREAGNVVVLRHDDGWETFYGHLREGSVAVAVGDRVEAGRMLGLVGLSGNSEFPHVEFGVLWRGRAVDPFVGVDPPPGCGPRGAALWSDAAAAALPYIPAGLLAAGWHHGVPEPDDARNGAYGASTLPRNAEALVFWVDLFGLRAGDVERMVVRGPAGGVVARHEETVARSQAQLFRYAGRSRPPGGWPPGRYRAEFTLERPSEDRRLVEAVREIEVR